MSKVIGIAPSSFVGDKGEKISGFNVYLSFPLASGSGHGAERVYLTDRKVENSGYMPVVGDEVDLTYNKFGKVASMHKIK